MEPEIEVEQMLKGISRDFSDGALSDIRKYGVEKFAREGSPDPRCAVCFWRVRRYKINRRCRIRVTLGTP